MSYRDLMSPSLLPLSVPRFDDKGKWVGEPYLYKTIRMAGLRDSLIRKDSVFYYWNLKLKVPVFREALMYFADAPIPSPYYQDIHRSGLPYNIDGLKTLYTSKGAADVSSRAYLDRALYLIAQDKFLRDSVVDCLSSIGFVYEITSSNDIKWLTPTVPVIYGVPTAAMQAIQKDSSELTYSITYNGSRYEFIMHSHYPSPAKCMMIPFYFDSVSWIALPIHRDILLRLLAKMEGDGAKAARGLKLVLFDDTSDESVASYHAQLVAFGKMLIESKLTDLGLKGVPASKDKNPSLSLESNSYKNVEFIPAKSLSPITLTAPHMFFSAAEPYVVLESLDSLRRALYAELTFHKGIGRQVLAQTEIVQELEVFEFDDSLEGYDDRWVSLPEVTSIRDVEFHTDKGVVHAAQAANTRASGHKDNNPLGTTAAEDISEVATTQVAPADAVGAGTSSTHVELADQTGHTALGDVKDDASEMETTAEEIDEKKKKKKSNDSGAADDQATVLGEE